MRLSEEIRSAIDEEAVKLGMRFHAYHNGLALEHQRLKQRIKTPPPKHVQTPEEWMVDRKFNPFYVRKHSKAISRAIAKKIIERSYVPNSPFLKKVPKPGGGFRTISVYQVPDSAVSAYFYRILLAKNRHRFSGYSYAYRDDRNAHFAIQDISVDLESASRVFVAEFDFSKFFDSISHDYLFDQFDKNGFSISPRDVSVIRAFLGHSGVGVPQGTSISLFLANLACWKLDKRFETEGLRFARYADDTVVWSLDYNKISRAPEIISEFSKDTGVSINVSKSNGVRVLCSPELPCEFSNRTSKIEFLGYSISVGSVGIKGSSVEKIKRHISYLLYRHLLQPLSGSTLQAINIPANDRDSDLLSALVSIRRYLYGNLSEDYISRFLAGGSGRLFYKGVMSFYPLVSDKQQMQELDGWLVNQVWKVVRRREKLLRLKWKFDRRHSFPFNLKRDEFVVSLRNELVKGRRLYAIPSFVIVYLALRKAVSEGGLIKMLGREEY